MDLNMDRHTRPGRRQSRTHTTYQTLLPYTYVNRHQQQQHISSSSTAAAATVAGRVKDPVELSILHVSQLRLILSCRLITSRSCPGLGHGQYAQHIVVAAAADVAALSCTLRLRLDQLDARSLLFCLTHLALPLSLSFSLFGSCGTHVEPV